MQCIILVMSEDRGLKMHSRRAGRGGVWLWGGGWGWGGVSVRTMRGMKRVMNLNLVLHVLVGTGLVGAWWELVV